jgi:hypothetical protein
MSGKKRAEAIPRPGHPAEKTVISNQRSAISNQEAKRKRTQDPPLHRTKSQGWGTRPGVFWWFAVPALTGWAKVCRASGALEARDRRNPPSEQRRPFGYAQGKVRHPVTKRRVLATKPALHLRVKRGKTKSHTQRWRVGHPAHLERAPPTPSLCRGCSRKSSQALLPRCCVL